MRPKSNSRTSLGFLVAMGGALSYSIMAIFVQRAHQLMNTYEIVFCISAISASIVGFICRKEIKQLFKLNARYVWMRSIFGSLSVFFYFYNLKLCSVGEATLLTDMSPLFVVILSYLLFGFRLNKPIFIGIILSFFGAGTLFFPDLKTLTTAVVGYGLLSAFFGASAYISLKQATKSYSSMSIVFSFLLTLTILSLILIVPSSSLIKKVTSINLVGIVIFNIFGQYLTTQSYKYLDTYLASFLGISACIWGFLFDVIFFDRSIESPTVAAVILIIIGIFIVTLNSRHNPSINKLRKRSTKKSIYLDPKT